MFWTLLSFATQIICVYVLWICNSKQGNLSFTSYLSPDHSKGKLFCKITRDIPHKTLYGISPHQFQNSVDTKARTINTWPNFFKKAMTLIQLIDLYISRNPITQNLSFASTLGANCLFPHEMQRKGRWSYTNISTAYNFVYFQHLCTETCYEIWRRSVQITSRIKQLIYELLALF